MTVRTVQNIVRVPIMVNGGGYTIGWRETYTYDDATASPETIAMIGRGVTAGRLVVVDGAPITPDPTPNPGTGTPTTPTTGVKSLNGRTGDLVLSKSDVGLGNVNNTSDANKPVSTAGKTALDGKVNITDLQGALKDYALAADLSKQVAAILTRLNAVEVAQGGTGGGTTPINPTVDPTAGEILFDRDFRTLTATNIGGTAGPSLTDPGSNFHIRYLTSTYNALGLWNADNSTTRNYFLMLSQPIVGSGVFGVRVNTHSPSTTNTVVYPRAVLAADTDTNPTSWYGVTRNSAGIPIILRTTSAGTTVIATAADTATFTADTSLNALYDPTTGKITVYAGDTDTVVVEVTDPTPLMGRYCGIAYRGYATQAAASANQTVNRLTIKSYATTSTPGTGTGGGGTTTPEPQEPVPSPTTYSVATVTAAPTSLSNVQVTWAVNDPNSEVTGFEVQRGTTTVASLPSTATSYTDTTVTAGGYYRYGVRAMKDTTPSARTYDYAVVGSAVPGTYSISGTSIVGPNGQPFVPFGANIGVNQAIGGNQWSDESITPHTKEAAAWGWNTIRLTTYCTREVTWIGTGDYKDGTAYQTNDRVAYGGVIYSPFSAFTASGPFPAGNVATRFAANTAYTTTSKVEHNGTIWNPNVAFTSGATFVESEWTDTAAPALWRRVGTNSQVGRQKAINTTFAAAHKYADAGFAVVVAVMDITQGNQNSTATKLNDIEDFAVQFGNEFKNDQRVWFNINEPIGPRDETTFTTWNRRFYDALRSTGAQNIYVADVMTNAQDAPWGGTRRVYDTAYGPALLNSGTGGTAIPNLLFGYHCYGGLSQSADPQATFDSAYSTYFTRVQQAGLAMALFEAGYKLGATEKAGDGTGDDNRNIRGYRACLKVARSKGVGAVVWDGTFDIFSLKNTTDSGGWHGRPFWYRGAYGDLSPMALEFWNVVNPTFPAPATAPTVTTGTVTSTTIPTTWTRINGASSYELSYKKASDSTWTVAQAANTTAAATLTGLTSGTSYDVRVRGAGSPTTFGPYSTTVTVSTS